VPFHLVIGVRDLLVVRELLYANLRTLILRELKSQKTNTSNSFLRLPLYVFPTIEIHFQIC